MLDHFAVERRHKLAKNERQDALRGKMQNVFRRKKQFEKRCHGAQDQSRPGNGAFVKSAGKPVDKLYGVDSLRYEKRLEIVENGKLVGKVGFR